MQTDHLVVHSQWDEEARVWVASSFDVPGLVTEADSVEALIQKLSLLIPELLELNGRASPEPVRFELLTRRTEIASHSNT